MTKKSISENWFSGGFKILFNSIKLYFINFETFIKLLAFPVLGQLLGLFLIFTVNYFFVMNVPELANTIPLFNNITFVFSLLIICIIPCFLIFAKAFFDYVLAMGSLNLMANHILDKGKLNDAEIHKDILKSHLSGYFGLLIILSLIFLILSFPLFWVLLIPIAILLSLSIQAFVMEDNLSPFGAIRRSYLFVRYNFLKTLFLLVLLTIVCYFFLPEFFNWLVDKANMHIVLTTPIDLYINLLPVDEFNNILSALGNTGLQIQEHNISTFIIQSAASFIIIGFSLPIRAIACCDLYRELRGKNITRDDAEIKKIAKRAVSK